MNLIKRLLETKSNAPEVAYLMAKLLNVNLSMSTIEKELEEHPDYPSLLSISDIFSNYGISNLSLRVDAERLFKAPVPFVTQLKDTKRRKGQNFFTIVTDINASTVRYFDVYKHIWSSSPTDLFFKKWSGIILITEVEENPGEKDYSKISKEEKRKLAGNILTATWLPVFVLILGLFNILNLGREALFPFLYLIVTLFGSITTTLLLWYEIDQSNSLLQQICTSGNHTNCSAILKSKAAKIWGISWSQIGFIYFTGNLLLLLFLNITNLGALRLSALFNCLALPYVFFSIHYQWRTVKQWCILCLFVQLFLFLQLIISLFGGWHIKMLNSINYSLIFSAIASYGLCAMVIYILMSSLRNSKQKKELNVEFQKIKHNADVFQSLLKKEHTLVEIPYGLGIKIGNPDAPYKIVKICHPYCGPCSRAHHLIEDLVKNNPNVELQIIFKVQGSELDKANLIVKHLLALDELYSQQLTNKALDDWYLSPSKNYDYFSLKYPIDIDLKKQATKIDAMNTWCLEHQVVATPTFYISTNNGTTYYKLPKIYNAADLKYFFSN